MLSYAVFARLNHKTKNRKQDVNAADTVNPKIINITAIMPNNILNLQKKY